MPISPERAASLQEQLARIANVEAASVHLDARGEIEAIDLIADRGRSPQRIVRDAEIILRRDAIDLDHRKIGVAALDSPAQLLDSHHRSTEASTVIEDDAERPELAVLELDPDQERIRLGAIHSTTRDGAFTAEVELAVGPFEGVPGRCSGPAQDPAGCAAVVARATLEAVRNLLQPGYEAQLRELRVVDMGDTPLVAVSIDFGEGRRLKRLAGACLQHGSLQDAAVYATLDAINRPLGRARFRQLAVLEERERARA